MTLRLSFLTHPLLACLAALLLLAAPPASAAPADQESGPDHRAHARLRGLGLQVLALVLIAGGLWVNRAARSR